MIEVERHYAIQLDITIYQDNDQGRRSNDGKRNEERKRREGGKKEEEGDMRYRIPAL